MSVPKVFLKKRREAAMLDDSRAVLPIPGRACYAR